MYQVVVLAAGVLLLAAAASGADSIHEESGYVTVRPGARLFWWLFRYSGNQDWRQQPLVMWLQGGPGGASTGHGNFNEIGPLDINMNPRSTTWVKKANVIFVDQPVGTGYSYVESGGRFATNNTQVGTDLVTLCVSFFEDHPELQTVPFYVFGQSYGGKMAVTFARELLKAVKASRLKVNLKGVALVDSWISPIDYVLSWSPYLISFSLIDEKSKAAIDAAAAKCVKAFDAGRFVESTDEWLNTEGVILAHTNRVNFYNVLKDAYPDSGAYHLPETAKSKLGQTRQTRDLLDDIMNGVVKAKLDIPSHVRWGSQAGTVFDSLEEDFMKPVIDEVDELLATTDVEVIVITGQLDLIVDTIGTNWWVQKLKWSGMGEFNRTTRLPIRTATDRTAGFVKNHGRLSYYYIMKAGHSVPEDAPQAAFKMLDMILFTKHRP